MAVVLIVEDDDPKRVLAESIIQDRGHTTLSASTVEQALALLEGEQRVDLLFTDLGLHDDLEAGLKAAQAAVERIPGLPVLYTTGQATTDGMRAMFVERSGFIAKPYTVDQLSAAIEGRQAHESFAALRVIVKSGSAQNGMDIIVVPPSSITFIHDLPGYRPLDLYCWASRCAS
jgi:DNA-binding NtrC family response regulator